jgi:hypothetical protein
MRSVLHLIELDNSEQPGDLQVMKAIRASEDWKDAVALIDLGIDQADADIIVRLASSEDVATEPITKLPTIQHNRFWRGEFVRTIGDAQIDLRQPEDDSIVPQRATLT